MSFLDDLEVRVKQAATDIDSTKKKLDNIQDYYQNQIRDPLVKVGNALTGNLSEAEIAAGKTANPAQQVIAKAVANPGMSAGVMLGLGVLVYFIFFSKKSRG